MENSIYFTSLCFGTSRFNSGPKVAPVLLFTSCCFGTSRFNSGPKASYQSLYLQECFGTSRFDRGLKEGELRTEITLGPVDLAGVQKVFGQGDMIEY